MKRPICMVAAIMTLLLTAGFSSASAADHPDVLFIAIDDLNDWVGHLGGYPGVKTPNIDALAKRGVSFTNAHCVAPACNPSRAGLLSGLRPFTTGVYHNNHDWQNTLADVLTLPQFYRQQGYNVLGGGKIFHGSGVIDRYWDDYYNRKELPGPKIPYNGLNKSHFDWSPLDVDETEMPDYKLVTWASDVLKQPPGEKPLFLAVGIVKPHLPWFAPQKYFDMYPLDEIRLPEVPDNDLDDIPELGVKMARPEGDHKAVTEANEWRKAVRAYLATITFVDDQVGRLIKALDDSDRADETVIVLWGDHGWHLGEKHHWRKFSLWEEATRAPLLFVAPNVTKPNRLCAAPVDFLSIYPTLADLCGLPLPSHLEGKTLRPLLENPVAEWKTPALTTHGRGNHAVRNARWRYIRYRDGSEELYDHQNDPMEWTNLAPNTDDAKKGLAQSMPTEEVPEAPKAAKYRKR
jgi:arylsulfatase A-like enzyme